MSSPYQRLAALLVVGALGLGPSAAAADTVTIGLAQSITGGSPALYGIEQKNAAELAVDEANAAKLLGDRKIQLVHLDDGADRGQTVNVFQRLIGRDKVVAIIGPTLSTGAFAADPIAQKAGVPVVAASNTASGVTDIGDYIFRVSPPEDRVTPGVLKTVVDRFKVKRVAQIYGIDDQLTKSAYNTQKKALEALGVEIVATETFQRGDVEFAAQLTKIKAAQPDLIVLGSLAEESAGILRQARQLGIPKEVVFVGTQSSISSKFFELAGPAAEGLIAGTAWYIDSPEPKNQEFVKKYEARFGRKPDIYSAYGYDAASLVINAIKEAGSGDRKAVRDNLAKTKNFPGVLGPIGFDAGREPVIDPKILVASGGRFVIFK
ncbi:ABC transporter substrate-binding protein [Chelatococcus reniformis]|uniref:Ethanolamine utilization protein EutJ n=1 Tax=Chelatococcus reniformis TaxID=1494448 RepID=A0A916TYR8_9HYPH|nr:ABC transporter substrate-binding protein [Chelatococcus reniformis]GGC53110.1 ethanolamine utilization protein EutJ [Chelatococcus reniformis]